MHPGVGQSPSLSRVLKRFGEHVASTLSNATKLAKRYEHARAGLAQVVAVLTVLSGITIFGSAVIVDFEKDRVKEIAKSMTEPLSDALYRSKRPPQTVEFRVERALAESRPRLESLPTTILAPTVEDRIQEKFIAVQFKRAAEQARRR